MNAGVFPAGNPWKPPPIEATELPVVCAPEMSATTGRGVLLLFALLWGGFAIAQPLVDRARFDGFGEVLWGLLAVGSLAGVWWYPRLVRAITVTAEGLVDHRCRHAGPETLPWSDVESITPVPGVADTVTVRFTAHRSIELSGRKDRRRGAIEAIYALALPPLALRLVEAIAAGETVHFAPWAGGLFEPRRDSPRGLWLGRDGIRVVTRRRETSLAWRDVESIEWRGFGRAVLHAGRTSVTIDGHFENASALLAVLPEMIAGHGDIPFERMRPPSTSWYAGLYALGLAFGALLLVLSVSIYAPTGQFLHLLGRILQRAARGDRDALEIVGVCFGSMLPFPHIIHAVLEWAHWRARRRGPQPTSLWTGPGVSDPAS